MADRIVNPFQNVDIFVPAVYHPEVARFSRRNATDSVDDSPFTRMVDFWWFSLCVAVRCGLEPVDLGPKPVKIIDGAIFGTDPWRIHMLLLVGIGLTGDIEIVLAPRKVAKLASELAAAGMPRVVSMLKDGDAQAIWNLSEGVLGLLREDDT